MTRLVIARDISEMVYEGLIDPLHFLNFAIKLLKKNSQNEISVIIQITSLTNYICLNYINFENQSNPRNILFNVIVDLINENVEIKDALVNNLLDIIDTSKIDQIELLVRSMEKTNENPNIIVEDISKKRINLDKISSVKYYLSRIQN